jgi:hypothetical protein
VIDEVSVGDRREPASGHAHACVEKSVSGAFERPKNPTFGGRKIKFLPSMAGRLWIRKSVTPPIS